MARGSGSARGRGKTSKAASAGPPAAKTVVGKRARASASTPAPAPARRQPSPTVRRPSPAQASRTREVAVPAARRQAAAAATGVAAATVVSIRPVRPADLAQVIAIDSIVTGIEKAEYWRTIHRRYGDAERAGRRFLVAEANGSVAGFVIGEVRDWEFGSPPCGWVFAIDVHPQFRLARLGTQLVSAMADWFRSEGVSTMRTILARENTLILSFFRSLGMTTGPFIPLEIDLHHPGFFPIPPGRAA
ncbi:MAG: GNAT family N-acetyltransferase [Burkholderiaceae bacterium]|nr:GNAT family N-acetyltransferase [Burkholderiaceae bacterium]